MNGDLARCDAVEDRFRTTQMVLAHIVQRVDSTRRAAIDRDFGTGGIDIVTIIV